MCKDCAIVQELADRLLDIATNQTKPDVDKMCDYLTKYQAHQLRGKLQGIRCHQLRQHLEPDTCHMILDFKMKWLPVGDLHALVCALWPALLIRLCCCQMAFREASGEWFGKKGICWHGAVITLPAVGDEPQHHVTVHDILYSETKQDAITVLSIVESLLAFVRRRWPHIRRAVLQPDNAACY